MSHATTPGTAVHDDISSPAARIAPLRIVVAAGIALASASFPSTFAHAQSAGTGGAAGGVGATGGLSRGTTVTASPSINPALGTTSGSDIGTSGTGSTAGGSAGTEAGISTLGSGSSGTAAATEGDSTINPINADAIARSGNPGSAAAGSAGVGGSGGSSSMDMGTEGIGQSGTGTPADYEIRRPRVGVDLDSIRGAMSADPSATPKANGD